MKVLGILLSITAFCGVAHCQTTPTIADLLASEVVSRGIKGVVPSPRPPSESTSPGSHVLKSGSPAGRVGTGPVVGLIVRFKDPAVRALAEANQPPPLAIVEALRAASPLQLEFQKAMSGGLHVFSFPGPIEPAQAAEVIKAVYGTSLVDVAEPDSVVTRQQGGSSDPLFKYQWSLLGRPEGFVGGVSANAVWPTSVGSGTPIVAIVDSGVLDHPEFADRLLPGYSFVSADGRRAGGSDPGTWTVAGQCGPGTQAANSSWHGTHVTGIIAADGANAFGIAGVSWKARILPVRALGKCGGSISDILDAIQWSAGLPVPGVPRNPNPANIINLSLSGRSPTGCSLLFQESINRALGQGALLVVAAGNLSDDAAQYTPANCSGVLTTYATDPNGDLASYSNLGFIGGIAAPGGDITRYGQQYGILSTVGSGTQERGLPDYAYMQGTSMAAPHVAGVAALALAFNPNLSGAELAFLLQFSALPFPKNSGCATYGVCGSGMVNALLASAVAAAISDRTLVYEFFNSGANHYFRTGSKNESSAVNRGSAGPGWYDTLNYFYAWNQQSASTAPVCRFYSPGANSHFYTVNAHECEAVKINKDWNYEGIAFYAKVPSLGQCASADKPVYRVYNNRHAFNDQNHRFTTNLATYQLMVSKGWLGEGVALCV